MNIFRHLFFPGFSAAYTLAHELGHSLGMSHDKNYCKVCPNSYSYAQFTLDIIKWNLLYVSKIVSISTV